MNISILQHVSFEGPGIIYNWALNNKHNIDIIKIFEQHDLHDINRMDCLIIMGGPMNTYEYAKYPWLLGEKRYVEEVIKQGKLVMGICLGAQIIADVLGAKVYKNKDTEIGWFPVALTKQAKKFDCFDSFPDYFDVLHWHSDTFDLPEGAIRIAENDVTKNQAFVYNDNVIGFQFHMEMTRKSSIDIIDNCRHELKDEKFIQSEDEIINNYSNFEQSNLLMNDFLSKKGGLSWH